MSILEFQATRKEWLDRLEAESHNTWKAYKVGINKWDDFLKVIGKNDDEVLKELKAKNMDADTYVFLNRYMGFLAQQKIKRASIDLAFAALRSWCAANGVMLFNEYIKRFVNPPKARRELRVTLTHDIIKTLTENAPKGMRVVLVVLLSSGMRISEVLQLKVKDVKVNLDPVQINVKAETTKTKEQRTAYISDEAKRILMPYLEGKKPDDLVFVKEYNKLSLISFETRFSKLRLFCGLTDKYDDDRTYHVNLHAFRAYFHTQATKILGGDTAHALLGHHKYLDQYFRLEEKERGQLYKKLEPYVTVSNDAIMKSRLEEKDRQLLEMEKMKSEILKLKAYQKREQDKKRSQNTK